MRTTRRQVLSLLPALVGALASADHLAKAGTMPLKTWPISCNSYTWVTFYERQGKTWMADPDASLTALVQAGLTAYEPAVTSPDDVIKLVPLLKKHRLAMPSLYVNSTLHRADEAQKSIDSLLSIAKAAQSAGTTIFVTNPSPIKWGSDEDKTDADLIEQARNLDKLGAALHQYGITLAYHTHAPEHRQGAREFHHMMVATDPKNVSLCLDAHWIYRGSGNSQVALFDIVKLYGKRITEVHIRQSRNGIWQETFGDGDIDYRKLAADLKVVNVRPLLVLEQCLEKGSPNTMGPVEATKQNMQYTRTVFSGLV